jgi:hypothetical protein
MTIVVRARTRGDSLCQLTMELSPEEGPYPEGKYLSGILSVEILGCHFAFPLVVESKGLRRSIDEARSLDAHDLDRKAVLWDYDMQPVLALTRVSVLPPIIVMSGEYVGPFSAMDPDDLEKYPHRALNTVQYTGLVIALGDVDRLVSELRSGLKELGSPWADHDGG